MRYSKVISCGIFGIKGTRVEIEVSLLPGISSFEITGLGDSAIRESKNRIHASIRNSGYDFPKGRIIVGLAPAFMRKHGTSYDLPIAVGILAASKQIPQISDEFCITGEMSLNGEVRMIPGVVSRILTASSEGSEKMIIPYGNSEETGFTRNMKVYCVKTLTECVSVIRSNDERSCFEQIGSDNYDDKSVYRDISTIIGQRSAVEAMQIAAAGWHNIMMTGSPGCGKTSMAEILPGILPELDHEERVEVAMIYSSAGITSRRNLFSRERPFRAPHHSITTGAMTGGGTIPGPGEMTLAHKGVLFLDEINEFRAEVLENLRQPLEDHQIRLSRQRYQVDLPADFMLVAASNPCKCGNLLERDTSSPCRCTQYNIEKYMSVISGALADRIDIYIDMCRIPSGSLSESMMIHERRDSPEIRKKIGSAWEMQFSRCIKRGIKPFFNSRLPSEMIGDVFGVDRELSEYAKTAVEKLELSVRTYQKMIRIARTIADYEGEYKISRSHFARALQYRRKR